MRFIRSSIPLALSQLLLSACFSDTPSEPQAGPLARAPARRTTPEVTITGAADLGTLGGGSSIAYGINAGGEIVGRSQTGSGAWHAFRWASGVMTDLGTLGGDESGAYDINDAGQVVGGSDPPAGIDQNTLAFIWQSGNMSALPFLGCAGSGANAVNAVGQVAGYTSDSECLEIPAIWNDGSVTRISYRNGIAFDINIAGQVVGRATFGRYSRAFLWQDGTLQELGTLGGNRSYAAGINASGQIVGAAQIASGGTHAFIWNDGVMTDLGTMGGKGSSAADINDVGQVVGVTTTLTRLHPFWWQDGVLSDLGTLGGDSVKVHALNPSGEVVGAANYVPGGPLRAVRWRIPSSDFWSIRRAFPPARRSVAVAGLGGLLYAIAGVNSAGSALTTVQAYDPSTNTWAGRAPLPAARQRGNGAVTIAGRIYVAGGQNAAGNLTRKLYRYNPKTDAWTTRASMPVPGGCGGSAAIAGKLYVFSGCTRLSSGAEAAARLLHRYDPATNRWTTLASAPAVHLDPGVAALGGKLIVVGGSNASGAVTRRVDVYDPATNAWSTKKVMPTARVAPAAAVVGSSVYVIGGRTGTTYLDAVEAYDPVTDTWTSRRPMINARAGLGAGAINNVIYAVGGRNESKLVAVNERYTP